jgi:Protein of unknown function (DUF993)
VAALVLPGRSSPLVIPSPGWADSYPPSASRRVFAAAHVAAFSSASGPVIDWEATLRFREHLWAHGFGVAEAMDTAQRGMGLSWDRARELIARSAAAASGRPLVCGVGTDQLPDGGRYRLGDVIEAYLEQLAFVQSAGAPAVLMASRALAATARGAFDYLSVYRELLGQAERPVILHWLGEAFDPALRGYWGGGFDSAAGTVLSLIEGAPGKVDGVKLSLLDPGLEVALRRRLPAGVRLYTGDDFNYASLIRGDASGFHSDALLGAFAAVTAPAAAALAALDRGDLSGYDAAIGLTVPLSRVIFEPPTYLYKVGIAFLAWLNGFQPHFGMLGGLRRPLAHLIRVFELAAQARALVDPELAASRMSQLLATVAA